ncbi:DNA recombination protein RmuC [Tepidamorphus sp. 3E244]|uniref:DNA recombination protein RmuC n=1 Tax=Tepidamorphus sp. 3E244 TaxID=3385498 RepID=UPI0038FC88F3
MLDLDTVFLAFGDYTLTYAQALTGAIAGFCALALVALIAILAAWRSARTQKAAAYQQATEDRIHAQELETRLGELTRQQAEMTGRMSTMAEVFGSRQSELAKGLREQLDGFGHRLGQNMTTQAQATHDNLTKLNERLAVIDNAQKNITELSRDVVGLQEILSNKQRRGAFGQVRMEAIIGDGLPSDSYTYQATLSNQTRPDCLIRMPNGAPGLVVDAKFPLEAFNAFREADNDADKKTASTRLRSDVGKHVSDISERYFIPGETQDIALMFVPSESIYAELHEYFEDIAQRAYKSRIVIVGPSLLMLAIQVVQAILRDQRMREQAHVIQHEVTKLLGDVGRLRDRVHKLQTHFGQASADIEQIVISAGKVERRGSKIESLEFSEEAEPLPKAMQRTLAAGE